MTGNEQYSNREIDILHNSLMDQMKTHNKATMAELLGIKDQTTKTNGRVTKLEKFMWIAIGAITVLSVKELSGVISLFF